MANPKLTARIVILGASGHGRVIYSIAEALGLKVDGFYDDNTGSCRHGGCYLGSFADLLESGGGRSGIIGIGDNRIRRLVAGRMSLVDFTSLVHPAAVVAADVEIGEGTVVMAGAVINPGCKIGKHCVINTGAILDHDCELEDFSSLGPGTAVGGNCQIGSESFVGIGAALCQGITIGAESLVGAGAVVVKDLPGRVVAVGVPARIMREREEGERYL